MKSIIKLLVISIIIINCNSSKNKNIDTQTKGLPLASQWILENFNDKEINNISKASYININEKYTAFEGNGGCNKMSGVVLVKDNSIKFEQGIMTEIACDDLAQEMKFAKNLVVTTNYKIVGGELFLYEKEKLLMTLESFRN